MIKVFLIYLHLIINCAKSVHFILVIQPISCFDPDGFYVQILDSRFYVDLLLHFSYLSALFCFYSSEYWTLFLTQHRRSHSLMFYKINIIKDFTKLTENSCTGVFFNKVAGWKSSNLLKKRFRYRCFLVNFVKILRARFFAEHIRTTCVSRN